MTTTFADYCATADARAAIAAKVEEWCQMLCLSLEHNYIDEAIRRQKFFAANDSSDFSNKRIEEIKNGDHYKFYIETGRKYHKIVMETEQQNKVFMPLLIRRLANFTRQHHTKHLQRCSFRSANH